MPYLQFITGSRDQDFEQLNPQASLVLGSGGGAHIRCKDSGVEEKHCTIYPAQGKFWLQDMGAGNTILNLKRLKGATEEVKKGDVFIIGRTFLKFWDEKPAGGGGGGGGGGADPKELEAAKKELSDAKAELDGLKASQGEAGGQVQKLEGELDEVRGQLEASKQELEAKQQELDSLREGKDEADSRASKLEEDLAAAKSDSETQAQAIRDEAQRERADMESALDASRSALDSLRSWEEANDRDPFAAAQQPSDLIKALDALGAPDEVRHHLEAVVEAEIDKQVLHRTAGPVLPLRGLKVEGSGRDLEAEVRAIRRRGEQVEAARKLGLHKLEAGELERLLGMARG